MTFDLILGTCEQAPDFLTENIVHAAIESRMQKEDVKLLEHYAVKSIIRCFQDSQLVSCKCTVYKTKNKHPVMIDGSFVDFDVIADLPEEEWDLCKEFTYAFTGELKDIDVKKIEESLNRSEWDLFLDQIQIQIDGSNYMLIPDFY